MQSSSFFLHFHSFIRSFHSSSTHEFTTLLKNLRNPLEERA